MIVHVGVYVLILNIEFTRFLLYVMEMIMETVEKTGLTLDN